jgi:hypothetical protein
MQFFVSHMSPHKRARIHNASCPDCRNGQGQEGQHRTGSGATGWDGPFATLAEAELFMKERFSHFDDTGKCGRCKPGVN